MENNVTIGEPEVLSPPVDENRLKTAEKPALTRDERGLFVPGNPGGPGRPKGKTIKELVREYLDDHPEDKRAFVEHFVKNNRDLAWQMLEGRPSQNLDHTSGGEPLPILGHVQANNGDGKNNPAE